ncbi:MULTISPECIES: AraC family transcriptional regulator [Kitasatospora]|uniref:AraC-like DNA-binding protein n=2 Tax=Kitasatospora TaxID=2063 RepID=A0ABT1J7U5_9ACTN|nr:AraC family transcriptional regulator [Kitasatospora paracochleata]MCP2312791.1 AraC-like DNA-binding protein [Kitasatospora paracochleata]
MDILTEAVASVRTDRARAARTDCRAPWGLRFHERAGAGFHIVMAGSCWLVAPDGTTTALAAGDLVFLRSGAAHVMTDDPSSAVVDFHPEPAVDGAGSPLGRFVVDGPGALTTLLCGSYHLDQTRPHPLVGGLPEVIHLSARHGRHPALRAAIELLGAELDRPRPGSDGIVAELIDLLFLYILRAWYDEQPAGATAGWAAALTDPAIVPALEAIHADPGHAWTVEELGGRVGLSRAAFARRFTALVGEPPLAYLTRWRMTTAARLLRQSDTPIGVVGGRVGYGSEFAFAKAFKRSHGVPPGQYRRLAPSA